MKDILGNLEANLDSHSLNRKDNIHSVQEALKEWVCKSLSDFIYRFLGFLGLVFISVTETLSVI